MGVLRKMLGSIRISLHLYVNYLPGVYREDEEEMIGSHVAKILGL